MWVMTWAMIWATGMMAATTPAVTQAKGMVVIAAGRGGGAPLAIMLSFELIYANNV